MFQQGNYGTSRNVGNSKGGRCVRATGSFSSPERIRRIIEQLPARGVALVSPDAVDILAGSIETIIPVDTHLFGKIQPGHPELTTPTATHDNTAYIIFTSGSTGLPKGVVSRAWRSLHRLPWIHGRELFFNTDSRVMQFSSYSWDVSITEIFTTLVYGGCICVLTDYERMNDIAGSISRMGVNWAYFTPR